MITVHTEDLWFAVIANEIEAIQNGKTGLLRRLRSSQ
jgi:hypothetical protein